MDLVAFNELDARAAAAEVRVWADIPAWVEAVVGARPFASIAEAEEVADAAARAWTPGDLDAALAHHPRIGQRPTDTGAEADASRREQASMSTASDDVTDAIARANAAYEERFGRVFLIRAAGRTPAEMLAEAERRLENEPSVETAEALDQLRQIALLRLRSALTAPTVSED